ncbi:kinase-like protein [Gigaspora margarita]|uniref:Kinase-like protein n=1 Tax=Gigaspora margarita TaxID=4874 RepID=A0A8H4ERJ1_GIGMA|nr:kinase-like protein [Gigaspora margarita]
MSNSPNINPNIMKETFMTGANVLSNFVPLVGAVRDLIEQIYQICEDAECNKEICSIMTRRIEIAEFAVEKLMRKRDKEKYLSQLKYFLSFKKFENLLKNIKEFTCKVSKLKGFRKYLNAMEVKKVYETLTREYYECMNELQFAIAIVSEIDRNMENQKVNKALQDVEDTLNKVDSEVTNANDKLDVLVQDISIIKSQIAEQPSKIHVKRIDPSELSEPPAQSKKNFRGNVVKKFNKDYREVACKPIYDFKNHEGELVILGKLSQSPYILQFYGLSYIDNHDVMVFDWAENGTLKDIYTNYDIPWTRKIRIIRDLCRGLAFLRTVNIFHHDVRCENVFIGESLDPKLGKFRYAREVNDISSNLSGLVTDIVRWMAPEQIEKYRPSDKDENEGFLSFKRDNTKEKKEKRNSHSDKGEKEGRRISTSDKAEKNEKGYTFNCEMYSFGMLIWELCYEKLPYENLDLKEISDLVLARKREKLLTGKFDNPNDKKIQEKLIEIIKKTWDHEPRERIDITKLNRKLEKLTAAYPIPLDAPRLLKDKTLNFDGTYPIIPDLCESEEMAKICDDYISSIPLPLEKGIKLHKNKDYKNAWKCFEENANLGDSLAKYWQGYYLYYGLDVEKDIERSKRLFKEAADHDHSDAQCRYAVLLLSDLGTANETRKQELCKEILHYFKLAADNKHAYAMYYLGDIYVYGKLKVDPNRELGLKYLRLAASQHNDQNSEKAIKLLEKLDEKV